MKNANGSLMSARSDGRAVPHRRHQRFHMLRASGYAMYTPEIRMLSD